MGNVEVNKTVKKDVNARQDTSHCTDQIMIIIDNARCKKYCSCREFDVFFETDTYFCGLILQDN